MEWVIVVVIALLLIGYVGNSIAKFGQTVRGRSHCQYCGKRLGKAPPNQGFGFATHCRKCGRIQPWAE